MEPIAEPWLELAACATPAAQAESLEEIGALAREAEARGCARLWIAASLTAASRESIALAVSALAGTRRLRVVAAGLAPPRGAEWIRLAEDAATADGIAGGRLELAFAGLPDADAIERLRAAWAGVPVALGDGAEPVEVHPQPAQGERLPLWILCETKRQASDARALGLGCVTRQRELAEATPGAVWVAAQAPRAIARA